MCFLLCVLCVSVVKYVFTRGGRGIVPEACRMVTTVVECQRAEISVGGKMMRFIGLSLLIAILVVLAAHVEGAGERVRSR